MRKCADIGDMKLAKAACSVRGFDSHPSHFLNRGLDSR